MSAGLSPLATGTEIRTVVGLDQVDLHEYLSYANGGRAVDGARLASPLSGGRVRQSTSYDQLLLSYLNETLIRDR